MTVPTSSLFLGADPDRVDELVAGVAATVDEFVAVVSVSVSKLVAAAAESVEEFVAVTSVMVGRGEGFIVVAGGGARVLSVDSVDDGCVGNSVAVVGCTGDAFTVREGEGDVVAAVAGTAAGDEVVTNATHSIEDEAFCARTTAPSDCVVVKEVASSPSLLVADISAFSLVPFLRFLSFLFISLSRFLLRLRLRCLCYK